ncbi:adenylosuccinate synthase [Pontibacter sp. BT310]|uniref:Adenylosuccinate synthetase n=1 Tax=Pontibacter populi TaxID=890055 RepID=A0ABS6XG73_9BACT|nr:MULTISPECIES: adenylosuccinate synthase [Pontibacter]MBJ6119301.1 adenylosuccinate synthase [Pontibacter sp. BT310]MBR0571729.1 adenylosuccinate synthase [Microvirga sp. STS03]MBW3366155.1 adenylosuccinate synthase [Pontibacter populi]
MAVDILLGLQWGDEGKGKIVDVLAPTYDIVARFQGGPNAGHTLEFEGTKHVLHQIPSGIFHSHIQNVIGNGVVLDPIVFRIEMQKLQDRGVDAAQNLYISKKASLILPSHKVLDRVSEEALGSGKIGSTLKGIGPTYQDKIGRVGLRVGDILAADFKDRYNKLVERHRKTVEFYGQSLELGEQEQLFFEAVDYLRTLKLADTEYLINEALQSGKRILAEGAQGSLLDVDFGTYPFVTSSTTMVAGACTGLGVAPKYIGEVYGIFKAYCTRVGSGPFPTELLNEEGEAIRQAGREFGSTTGRPRRCGWVDLPTLKYSIMLNGVTQLNMMKADVLTDFDTIKVCTHYKLASGEITDQLPHSLDEEGLEPIYEELPGWRVDLNKIEATEDLPEAFKNYLSYIESHLNVPITIVSVGPDRKSTLKREAEKV